ncbi:MAG: DUF1674 domain-containing protein [Devosiaceae bacterium]|nr:DUF1674 domain-containing protein [Devosiaceae bacterium]
MQPPKNKKPKLSTNAKNALKEAAARREKIDQANIRSKSERDGRTGLDPARFGDWEVKGIASDF